MNLPYHWLLILYYDVYVLDVDGAFLYLLNIIIDGILYLFFWCIKSGVCLRCYIGFWDSVATLILIYKLIHHLVELNLGPLVRLRCRMVVSWLRYSLLNLLHKLLLLLLLLLKDYQLSLLCFSLYDKLLILHYQLTLLWIKDYFLAFVAILQLLDNHSELLVLECLVYQLLVWVNIPHEGLHACFLVEADLAFFGVLFLIVFFFFFL